MAEVAKAAVATGSGGACRVKVRVRVRVRVEWTALETSSFDGATQEMRWHSTQ